MVSEKSQVKTAVNELEKELEKSKDGYNSIKKILDAHNKERKVIGEKYNRAQDRVREIEAAINTLSTLTQWVVHEVEQLDILIKSLI